MAQKWREMNFPQHARKQPKATTQKSEEEKKHGNIHTNFKTWKAGIDMNNKEKRKNRKHKNVMADIDKHT